MQTKRRLPPSLQFLRKAVLPSCLSPLILLPLSFTIDIRSDLWYTFDCSLGEASQTLGITVTGSVVCRLLPLFFRLPSFVFNSLQPLVAKYRGWGTSQNRSSRISNFRTLFSELSCKPVTRAAVPRFHFGNFPFPLLHSHPLPSFSSLTKLRLWFSFPCHNSTASTAMVTISNPAMAHW
jgi:hypothetical protein